MKKFTLRKQWTLGLAAAGMIHFRHGIDPLGSGPLFPDLLPIQRMPDIPEKVELLVDTIGRTILLSPETDSLAILCRPKPVMSIPRSLLPTSNFFVPSFKL
jgi:hypothetical protein